jgi:hypothetical protein
VRSGGITAGSQFDATDSVRAIVGANPDGIGYPASGVIDEVRAIDAARDDEWVRADAQLRAGGLVTIGAVEQ